MAAPTLSCFEIEHQAGHGLTGLTGGELEHLARDGRLQAVDAGDAVTHLEHRTDFRHVLRGEIGRRDFAQQDVFELAGTKNGIGGHVGGILAERRRWERL